MIIEQDLKKLFEQLMHNRVAKIDVGGSDITLRVVEGTKKLEISTPVYFGGNYIPHSVRDCVSQHAPFESGRIQTDLFIDEERFRIFLSYLGMASSLNNHSFIQLLEEFCWLAEEWRYYLDDHDKKDRIYINVR